RRATGGWSGRAGTSASRSSASSSLPWRPSDRRPINPRSGGGPVSFDPRCARCREGGRGQFYTYDSGDRRVWHFDVGLALRVARAPPETLGVFSVADLLEHAAHNEVDTTHVHHVDETVPLLAVTLEVSGSAFGILIDGNHRLRKLAALGVPDAQV